ncbi:Uncharacterized conserved protein [Pseudomonas aeruginosa]|nr:Uncharacterized conserved protein [Pseudomonas aeruginosa]
MHGFAEINKVASGMALHKKWRKTYFSTPSSMAHPAYSYWTGERFNKGKPTAKHIQLDVSHEALQQGRFCEDRIWRQIVTILDAEARGCDLFDLDELRDEYDAAAFQNLLMCQFVDDGQSIFRCRCCSRAWWRAGTGRTTALRDAAVWRAAGLAWV